MTLVRFIDPVLLILVGIAGVADGLRIILTKAEIVGGIPAGGWIALLGALLIGGTCLHLAKGSWSEQDSSISEPSTGLFDEPVIALAMLLIYIALIDPLGYVLSTLLFMAIYLRVFGHYRPLKIAVIATSFAFGSGWLWAAMNMMLSQGPLPWP